MRNINKYLVAAPIIATAIAMGLASCTKHDQVLDLQTPVEVTPVLNTDTLNATQGTATLQPIGGAAWDGTVEGVWSSAPKLTVHAVVPDLGNGVFEGFIGNSTDITMRSLYDASNIYFLMEFNCSQKNVKSKQWYFNPTTKRWAQESGGPVLNPDGESFRPPFIHDQFVMMFNIANSNPGFNTLSCYAACHKYSSYGGTPISGAEMYTNGPGEFLDVWRARMLQVTNCNQGQDTYIDWAGGTLNGNGRHDDAQVNSTDGGFNNQQSLTITGTATSVNVPKWIIPSGSYTNSAILLSATLSGGAAVLVTAVDTNGVLTLSDATTIDPSVGTDYKQIGAGDGPKCIPGSIVDPYTGSKGDITSNAFYTGSGWRILFKRALTTSDAAHDVDLSSHANQPFGVGVMFNGADGEHAIVAGLTLHFQ